MNFRDFLSQTDDETLAILHEWIEGNERHPLGVEDMSKTMMGQISAEYNRREEFNGLARAGAAIWDNLQSEKF